MVDEKEQSGWHLDKRVPIALIAALLLQTAGFVWWVATTTSELTQRVGTVEIWQEKNDATRDRLTAIETQVGFVRDALIRIERKLD